MSVLGSQLPYSTAVRLTGSQGIHDDHQKPREQW